MPINTQLPQLAQYLYARLWNLKLPAEAQDRIWELLKAVEAEMDQAEQAERRNTQRQDAWLEEERRHSDALLEKLRLSLEAEARATRAHREQTDRLEERMARLERHLGLEEPPP